MSILIVGGSGTVGRLIAGLLRERGDDVSVMSRSAEKLTGLPEGITGIAGNLADPPSLRRALDGFEKVMLITAVHPDESVHGRNAVQAARKAGVRKIVYLSVVMPPDATQIPHFASKVPIEQAVKEAGSAWTILRPNNFFQNDLWYRDAMLQYGFYPQPIGSTGIARVDARDIADCAVSALSGASLEGKTLNLNGPEALTGKDIARIWSEELGTAINHMSDDLTQWAESASGSLPAWMVHDMKIMYEFFQKRGIKASPAEMLEMEKALGHPPRKFRHFAAETAAQWKSENPR